MKSNERGELAHSSLWRDSQARAWEGRSGARATSKVTWAEERQKARLDRNGIGDGGSASMEANNDKGVCEVWW